MAIATTQQIETLVQVLEESTTAFLNGDMRRYLALTPHAPGFSFVNPFGGPPSVYEDRAPSIVAAAGMFHGGTANIELVTWHATADALVLVMIERQHASVGGLPDQDWSLRVTHVYRRSGGDWLLLHRHADPLVRGIGLEAAAGLARGCAA